MPPSRPARLTLLALLAACCAANAAAPVYRELKPDRRTDDEMGKLQGAWDLAGFSHVGEGDIAVPAGEYTLVFSGRRLSLLRRRKVVGGGPFTLDPAASPKRLDLRDGKGTLVRCIYRLDGDGLTLAMCQVGDAGPTDFKDKRASPLLVFRRAKRGK